MVDFRRDIRQPHNQVRRRVPITGTVIGVVGDGGKVTLFPEGQQETVQVEILAVESVQQLYVDLGSEG